MTWDFLPVFMMMNVKLQKCCIYPFLMFHTLSLLLMEIIR